MTTLDEITRQLVEMDEARIVELTQAAIDAGTPPEDILDKGLIPGMRIVGEQFENGEIFLPELLMSGEAMKAAMTLLKPLLAARSGGRRFAGRAAIGTVSGDLHDIGKNIMVMMLEGNGWEVTDLGVDVSPEGFCEAVRDNDYDVIGLSALLTTTMPFQTETIEALKTAGLRDKVKVAIGGSVCTQQFAARIGADCYATDVSDAVRKITGLITGPRADGGARIDR
jgi:5-methyltetrahydrofolate--homocysteine methyltransferase